MRKFYLFLFVGLFFSTANAQIPPTFVNVGYNFARSPLHDFNEFIELYNENPVKIGNYVFDYGFDKMHWLTGLYFGGGFNIKGYDFEINFGRKFNHTHAYYDPAKNPTYFRVDIGIDVKTIEAAAFVPYQLNKIKFSPGLGLGFVTRNYLYWQDEVLKIKPSRKDMKSYEKSNTISLSPMVQLAYPISPSLPVDLIARLGYQMMFSRMSLKNLYYDKGYWTTAESNEKNVSAGNLYLTLGIRLNINGFKIEKPERKVEAAPDYQPVLVGKVVDKESNLPLDAVVTFYQLGKPVASVVTSAGEYSLPTSSGAVYTVESKAFGYKTLLQEISIPSGSNEITHDIFLEKMAVGDVIKLENILFEKASAVLLPESYVELDKLYKFMLTAPTVIIEIGGHTSSEGDDKYNLKLSQERANAIAKYLIDKGISNNRIVAIGYGETKPVASNDTEEGRKLNRRVEFKILK